MDGDSARTLAGRWHAGQIDQGGLPYLDHLARVAAAVRHLGADAEVMAWLHDAVEDTGHGLRDLRAAGVPERVVAGVAALTHAPGEPRDAYYARILDCGDPLVLAVKLADIRDNADPSRLVLLDAPVRRRLERKYARALALLGASPGDAAGAC